MFWVQIGSKCVIFARNPSLIEELQHDYRPIPDFVYKMTSSRLRKAYNLTRQLAVERPTEAPFDTNVR